MSNKTVYELIFTAKNATSGATKQVASEVEKVKEAAAEASGAAAQMKSAYERAFDAIGEDVKNGTGEIQQQVSIQKKALADLIKQRNDLLEKHANAPTNGSKATYGSQLTALRSEIEGERQALAALQATQDQTGGSAGTLRTQIMNLRDEMGRLRIEGKAGTQEYEEKRAKLEQLGTVYRELQTEQRALSTGATQWGGAISGVQGLMGAYSAGSGIISMFVTDNERLQAIQTKLQATMSVMMGMSQVANTLHATSAFRIVTVRKVTELWAGAQRMVTGTLVASTAAAKLFWGAVSLGATVVIGAAIAVISRWVDKNREMRKAAEESAKAIAEANTSARQSAVSSVGGQIVEYRRLQTAWNGLGDDMKAKKKFVEENKDAFDKLGISVGDVSAAENLLVTNEAAFLNTIKQRAIAMAKMEIATARVKKALEGLLAAEAGDGSEPTDEDHQAATKAGNTAVDDEAKMSGGKINGGDRPRSGDVYRQAYKKSIDSSVAARKKVLVEAAETGLADALKFADTIADADNKVSEAMAGGNFKPLKKESQKPKGKPSGKELDPDAYLLDLTRKREDSEQAIMADGWQQKIATTNTAHQRWLADSKKSYDENIKQVTAGSAEQLALTDAFNEMVLSKEKQTQAQRVEILKKYSADAITEYMKQTGDVTGALDATVANLPKLKVQPVDIPTLNTEVEDDIIVNVKVRAKELDRVAAKIAELKGLLGMPGLSKDETDVIKDTVAGYEEYANTLGDTGKKQKGAEERNKELTDGIGAIGSVMSSLSGITDEDTARWLNWGVGVISAIASAIPAIAALIAARQVEQQASTGAAVAGGVASVASIPFVGWLMAGAAAASIIAAIASVPKFANGGIAYGKTMGIFGEYSGAQNNPEVVAPLNKLRALIEPSGGVGGDVRFRIEGRTLVGVIEKENNHKKRTR